MVSSFFPPLRGVSSGTHADEEVPAKSGQKGYSRTLGTDLLLV